MILEIIDELIKVNGQTCINALKNKGVLDSSQIDEFKFLLNDYQNLKNNERYSYISREQYEEEIIYLENVFIDYFGKVK